MGEINLRYFIHSDNLSNKLKSENEKLKIQPLSVFTFQFSVFSEAK